MKKWAIINDYNVEMDSKTRLSEIIDVLFIQGLGNCTITVAKVNTANEALEILKKYRCTARMMTTFANKVLVGDFYYGAEIEYNEDCEEWEQTGNFIFAEIAED